MKNEPQDKMARLSTFLLKFAGQNLFEDNLWTIIVPGFTFITMFIVIILGVMEPFLNEFNIDSLLESLELSGPYIQTCSKIIVLKLNKDFIKKILFEMEEKFWPLDKFGTALKKKQNRLINVFYRWPILLIIGFEFCVLFISVKPLFMSERMCPFRCYQLWSYDDHTLYYLLIYFLQMFHMFVGPFTVVGYDALFADMISRVVCQMMMLSKGIEMLKLDEVKTDEEEEESYRKVKIYIEHHCMLLRMVNDIQNIYSFILLYKIFAIIVTLCIGMYTMLVASHDIILILRAICLILAFLYQLTAYCIVGSYIEDECGNFAISAFNSGWDGKCSRRLKNALYMMIMRAQKPQVFLAGGIISTNLEGYGNILQFTISFYTFMSNRKDME